MIEQELILAFKNHKIDKYYKVLVFGNIKQNEETMEAYLFKDSRSAISKIYDNYIKGSVKIITEYTVEKRFLDTTLLDVKLVTGKMHQIRAHFAHINHPVVSEKEPSALFLAALSEHHRARFLSRFLRRRLPESVLFAADVRQDPARNRHSGGRVYRL